MSEKADKTPPIGYAVSGICASAYAAGSPGYYYKNQQGLVTIAASFRKSSAIVSTDSVAVMPAGYRPHEAIYLSAPIMLNGNYVGTAYLTVGSGITLYYPTNSAANEFGVTVSYYARPD